jgi:uncharacterized membrane protein
MSSTVTRVVQWTSLPVLLTIAALSPYAGRYELALKIGGCAFAVVLLDRAMRARQHLWACGFVGMAIVASPLLLVDQIFLLLGFACIASSLAVFFAMRPQPVAVL